MENALVSIIMPVYNAKKYLNKCINSVLNQTYKNIEFLIIDDGSTDGSVDIIKKYAKENKKIKAFYSENKGQSAARNFLLKKVNGDYITFVDSDDYIENSFIEILVNNLQTYNADISICNYYKVKNKIRTKYYKKNEKKIITSNKIDTLLSQKKFQAQMWNKLYKKELFDGIIFPINRIYEDLAVNYIIFDKAEKIIFDSTPLYNYVYNENSSLNQSFNPKKLDFIFVCDEIEKYLKQKNQSTKYIMQLRRYLYICTSNLICKSNDKYAKETFIKMRTFIKKNILNILLKDDYELKYKLAGVLLAYCPSLYAKIR